MTKRKIDSNKRTGIIKINKFGSEMLVWKYNSPIDIWVKFTKTDEEIVHTTWQHFCRGSVRSLYDRTVHGVGYIGVGKYNVTEKGKYTPHYLSWNRMIQRCYDKNHLQHYPTYKDCTVDEEWHNFQNFAQWYDDNYYEIEGETVQLDKDILVKGNKIYSPKTCVFVPKTINMLFVKCESRRGELPIGVSRHNRTDKYVVRCGKGVHVGLYDTVDLAFCAYKKYKEENIKSVARKFENKIPNSLYNAMLNYTVSYND